MTKQELKQATELSDSIVKLEYTIAKIKTQECEWIDFSFGNGSNKSTVCNDLHTIELVRELIFKETESKLKILIDKFNKL